jgi:hypothetical protein
MHAPRLASVFLLLALADAPTWALAQAQSPSSATPAVSATVKPVARPQPTKVAAAPQPAKPAESKPSWSELTAPQQQALAPLAGAWNSISEAQKRKWLALSSNYPKMAPAEQATLRSRMTEWVALSPQQRTQARLNFAETKSLSPDDKKAKWEAYQALPPEEKSKLANSAAKKTPGTAAAVKPVPAQKLATVPKPGSDAKTPRIAAGPQPDAGALNPGAPPAPAAQPH